jgi:biotin operon repressor
LYYGKADKKLPILTRPMMGIKKRYGQVARIEGILRILGTRKGTSISKLAEEFGVTKGTLYGDLKTLEQAGYPVLSEVVEGTTYWEFEPLPTNQVRT